MLCPATIVAFVMTIAALETVSLTTDDNGFPARFEERTSNFATMVRLTLLIGLLTLLSWPYLALAVAAATDPVVLAGITNRPYSAGLAFAGWCIGFLLLGIPAVRCLQRLTRRRQITLTKAYVEVADRSLRGSKDWGCPLSDFMGLTHRVRTRASGQRHEMFLVHPDPRHTLLLRAGESFSVADTQQLADLLGLPVIPVTSLYSAGRMPPRERRAVVQCIDTAEGFGCP